MKTTFVIPSHNAAGWLEVAVASVQKQTVKVDEIIIIDDGSTDSTPMYLNWLKKQDKRVVTIRNPKALGRSAARNQGNKLAKGDIIFVLDADDMATPKRVEWTLAKFTHKTSLVYGSAKQTDALGNDLGDLRADKFDLERAEKELVTRIVHSTLAYRKGVATLVPYHDGEVSDLGIDDWDFQMRCARSGLQFDFCPQVLGAYRHLETGISKTRDESKVLELKKKLLERVPA